MTLVIGCSMDRKGDGEEESQIIMADVATDNMVYGVLTETDRDSLLHIRTDDGDTLWVQIKALV